MSILTKNIRLLEQQSQTQLNASFIWSHLFGKIEKENSNIRYLFDIDFDEEDYDYLVDMFDNHTGLSKAIFEEKYINRHFQYNPQQRIFFLILLVGYIRYGGESIDDTYEFWTKFQNNVLKNHTDKEKFRTSLINYFFRYMGDTSKPLSGLYVDSAQTKLSLQLESKGDARYVNSLIFHAGTIIKNDMDEFVSIIAPMSSRIDEETTALGIYNIYKTLKHKSSSQHIDYIFELLRVQSDISSRLKEFLFQASCMSRDNHDFVYDFSLPVYIQQALQRGNTREVDIAPVNQSTVFLHIQDKKAKKSKTDDDVILNFEDARTYVRGLNLKSTLEWKKYIKGKLEGREVMPNFIPSNPNIAYKDSGWKSWDDWLNDTIVWLPFLEAKAFVKTLELANNEEWIDYCRGRFPEKFIKPDNIPNHPSIIYAKEWTGIRDWLGTNFRPFAEAREFIRSLGLNGQKGWQDYFTGKLTHLAPKPSDIPTNPSRYYKDEWKGVGDWTGTDRRRSFGEVSPWRDFEEAKIFVHSLELKDSYEWQAYLKGDIPNKPQYPSDIPNSPMYVYKDKWKGMVDWLGKNK